MGGNMPYVVEKGPYFAGLEAKIATQGPRVTALNQLRQRDPNGDLSFDLAALCGFDSSTLDRPTNDPVLAGDGRTYWDRYIHFDHDWLGEDAPNGYFWVNWQNGNPAAIMREGMERALEVSLGLDHGEDPAHPKWCWPIDFYWICQGPFFQCWILWRRVETSPDLGHVTVLFTTPPACGYPLNSEIKRPSGSLPVKPDYACPPEDRDPPGRPTLPQGMWVVGHNDYTKSITPSTSATLIKDVPLPGLVWTANNQDVWCVSPAEWEGGVLDGARRGYTYTPPPPPPPPSAPLHVPPPPPVG
jgi:hypothetical protein